MFFILSKEKNGSMFSEESSRLSLASAAAAAEAPSQRAKSHNQNQAKAPNMAWFWLFGLGDGHTEEKTGGRAGGLEVLREEPGWNLSGMRTSERV